MQTGNIIPQHLQNGYLLAYEKACTDLSAQNPAEIAASSGAGFDSANKLFTLKYLNEVYTVAYPAGTVSYAGRQDQVPVAAKVVILHYLLTGSGQPLSGQLISFKEIPGGMIYLQPFNGRVLGGFKALFGKNAALLVKAGEKLGGRIVKYGDAAVTMDVLPRVPVTYVIWEGDEEFPANATALFDATAACYLPTEDLVVAAAAGASLLGKTARALA